MSESVKLKTSVTEMLDGFGVDYVIKPHKNEVFTCEDAARERGVPVSQILKCMVGTDGAGAIYVMLIPGDKTLKIKKVRQLAGSVKVILLPPGELSDKFGLTVGAIAPFQFLGKANFYLDETVLKNENIDISSGRPDAGLGLKTKDLIKLLKPTICDIVSTS